MPTRPPDPPIRCAPGELRERLDYDDARLLAECEVDIYRASGPGGQHRNKVSTAIRLRHRPSGLVVTGSETRSQTENRKRALWRLREAIALVARQPLTKAPAWPPTVQVRDARLRVSESNPGVHHAVALVLDALADAGGQLRPAAERLGLTVSSLVRFLHDHPRVWREVARMRQETGLPPLKPP